jgi:hypothetical protein
MIFHQSVPFQGSILSIFYARVFHMKMLQAAFLCYILAKGYRQKSAHKMLIIFIPHLH